MPPRRLMPTAEQLANLARVFPPTPPRTAEIVVVLDDQVVTVPVRMSEAKLQQLRGLFAGKTDSEIFNELADELLARFGVRVANGK